VYLCVSLCPLAAPPTHPARPLRKHRTRTSSPLLNSYPNDIVFDFESEPLCRGSQASVWVWVWVAGGVCLCLSVCVRVFTSHTRHSSLTTPCDCELYTSAAPPCVCVCVCVCLCGSVHAHTHTHTEPAFSDSSFTWDLAWEFDLLPHIYFLF